MKEIQLTQGKVAIINDIDYETVAGYSWSYTSHGYAATRQKVTNKHIYMHRLIVKPGKGLTVDHINGNKLDNRRENLRACPMMLNSWNKGKHRDNKSGYKGVYKAHYPEKQGWKLKKVYAARIMVNGKAIWLGRHETPEQARDVYNEACVKYFGQFANHD